MATRVLVIVPANLREQWQEALDYFFRNRSDGFEFVYPQNWG
jgi:hypothetical protein